MKRRNVSYLAICALLPLLSRAQEAVTTIAGSALMTGTNNGPAATALFSDPTGLAMDSIGNLYIADNQNHVIRKLSTNGIVSTIAGQAGRPGSADGTGTNAFFNNPSGIAIGTNGLLYVTDTGNNTIRCIATNGVVTTLAGLAGQTGATNASGTLARFNSPLGIAIDPAGMIFVADSGNHLIRKVTPSGAVSTFAGRPGVWGTNDGSGTTALFNGPVGLALDSNTNLFVSDANNQTIRKITPAGIVTTWAGTPGVDGLVDGTGNAALFRQPAELKMDRNNNLYVVDSFNHNIRRITTNGTVTTVAGLADNSGTSDGFGSQSRFFNPYGLAIDHNGNLRIADTYNQTIRFAYATISASLDREPNGGGFIISWQSVPGDSYQVQFKEMMPGSTWENLGNPVTTTTSIGTITDSTISAGTRFYRVKLMP